MGLSIHQESLAAGWDELMALATAHYAEVTPWPDLLLNPCREAYRQLEVGGGLRLFVAREDESGKAVGYASFVVSRSLHHDSLQAYHDALYLVPHHRQGGAGLRLIDHAGRCLAAEGVQVVYQHAKTNHDHGPVLRRLGYEPIETVWAKRLDRGAA